MEVHEMAIAYTIDSARKLVETRVTGEVSAAEYAAYHARLLADTGYHPEFCILTDAREMTNVYSAEEVQGFASRLSPQLMPGGSRRAAVVEVYAAYGWGRVF